MCLCACVCVDMRGRVCLCMCGMHLCKAKKSQSEHCFSLLFGKADGISRMQRIAHVRLAIVHSEDLFCSYRYRDLLCECTMYIYVYVDKCLWSDLSYHLVWSISTLMVHVYNGCTRVHFLYKMELQCF